MSGPAFAVGFCHAAVTEVIFFLMSMVSQKGLLSLPHTSLNPLNAPTRFLLSHFVDRDSGSGRCPDPCSPVVRALGPCTEWSGFDSWSGAPPGLRFALCPQSERMHAGGSQSMCVSCMMFFSLSPSLFFPLLRPSTLSEKGKAMEKSVLR